MNCRNSIAVGWLWLLAVGIAGAGERPLRINLFDFESGTTGWRGNAWGGGKCGPEAAGEAKFGTGCLRGWYLDVRQGANIISPELPVDATWRKLAWEGVSFHLKGNGSPDKLTITLATDEKEEATYSRSVALEATNWHRVYLPFSTFWNRGGKQFDPARLRRLYFGGRGTQNFFADQIQLEAPHREVLAAPAWNAYEDGVYGLRLDAARFQEGMNGLTLRVKVELGNVRYTGEDVVRAGEITNRELFAVVRTDFHAEGTARLQVSLLGTGGKLVTSQSAQFQVFLPVQESKPSPLAIVPSPKEVTVNPGEFQIPRGVRLAAGSVDARVTGLLERELKRGYGVSAEFASTSQSATLVVQKHARGLPTPLAARWAKLPAEGGIVVVELRRVILAARDDAGLYYAAQTFLQNVELTTSGADAPRARCCTIVDWPSLPRRALTLSIPTGRWGYPNDAPVDVGFYCDFIERFVARRKFNTVVLLTRNGVRFDTHPEIAGPAAWSKAELRRFVQCCREHFIEPIPLVDSYGHADWMLAPHKELREDGDLNTACTSNPDTFKLLTDVYTELLEVFAPVKLFHIGMDEVRWVTNDTPPERRCRQCAEVPKWKSFADQVTRLHDWLHERGVRTAMWSDMLLEEHNGDAPNHTARALPLIPKDVLQCNWSTSLAPGSNRLLREAGCAVWQSNSHGVNREQAQFCEGNMFGTWNKMAWWGDGAWHGAQEYNYLHFYPAAEYSWNLWPEVQTLQPRLTWAWLREHAEAALERDGRLPEPGASAKTFFISIPGNVSTRAANPPGQTGWFGASEGQDLRQLPRGVVRFADTEFHISDALLDCISPLPPGEGRVSVPVGRKAASLRFLHTARLVAGHEEAFMGLLKRGVNWRGIPMGAYRISFEDGTTDECPILYLNNIKRWDIAGSIPHVFRSIGFLYAATEAARGESPDARDICLYVAQWVNPHPEKVIKAIEMTGSSDAVPVVFAITGHETR